MQFVKLSVLHPEAALSYGSLPLEYDQAAKQHHISSGVLDVKAFSLSYLKLYPDATFSLLPATAYPLSPPAVISYGDANGSPAIF